MKKHLTGIIMILGVLVTLSVLLYPTVSNYVNAHNQSRVVARYIDDIESIDEGNAQELLEAAHEYNKKLLSKSNRFSFLEDEMAEYKTMLNTGRGVIGILTVDKIGVRLPIYHGTDEAVLQVGLGHLPGTSLPVGGLGTHSFITGHRGLPSSKLLTDLDKMEEGDIFLLYVLGETLTYKVDNIQTVEPDRISSLDISPGKDYCTLVTCTPYGINTHRLLVRGYRVENARDEQLYADAKSIDKLLTILIFMVPVLPALIIFAIIYCRKIQRGGKIHR